MIPGTALQSMISTLDYDGVTSQAHRHCGSSFMFFSLCRCPGFIYVTLVKGVKHNGFVQETSYATLIVEDFVWGY